MRHKKCWANSKTFLCENLQKTILLSKSFSYENKILITHNFLCQNCTFLKQEDWKIPVYCTRLVNVKITSVLHVKKVKQVDWKSVVKTWKWISLFIHCVYVITYPRINVVHFDLFSTEISLSDVHRQFYITLGWCDVLFFFGLVEKKKKWRALAGNALER